MKFAVKEAEYGMTGSRPGKGNLGSARNSGTNQKYQFGDGPSGSGGGSSSAGPNGTTKGPAGLRITGFHGAPPACKDKSLADVRSRSNPMKR